MPLPIKLKPIVGVDARPLAYGYTGNSRYLLEALKFLIRVDSHFEYRLYSNREIHSVFLPFIEESGVVVAPILNYPGPLWLNFFLPKILKDDKVDLFWGTLQLLPFRKLPIPEVVNYHDLNFKSAPETMSRANYIQHSLLSRFTLKNADRIFCLSENTKNEISNYLPGVSGKLTVIYPGTRKLPAGNTKMEIGEFILTVATLEPRKNLSTLISAYLKIVSLNSNYPYRLVIAGRKGWGEKKLTEDLRGGKFESSGISYIENPDEETLSFLLKNCKFFLFPSKHEGFGLPIIEAMVEGKCCITSDIPVFREIIEPEYDMLADTMNVDSWVECIMRMTERPESNRLRNLKSERFSWYTTGKLLEEEISSVWNRHIKTKTMNYAV